jgi:hypothetical protein
MNEMNEIMDLDNVMKALRVNQDPFLASDKDTIRKAVSSTNSTQFFIKFGQFITDVEDIIHIHPTMIVSASEIPGSEYVGTYPNWPYLIKLQNWKDKSDSATSEPVTKFCSLCLEPNSNHADDCPNS